MVLLYINKEHCTSLDQLKGYFSDNLSMDSDVYYELLENGRNGMIADWLREKGEQSMADRLRAYSVDLPDQEYYICLKFTITGVPTKSRTSNFCRRYMETAEKSLHDKLIAQIIADVARSGKAVLDFHVGGVSFNMIRVEHGTFMMGATEEQENPFDWEKPAHRVTLTKDYYIGETPVTQALWKAVMGSNPSRFRGNNRPVEDVSWYDCHAFIKELNEQTGKHFRLPTEAEWEYAARGGNKSKHTQYSGSDNLDEVAWHSGNSNNQTHPVKGKKPNELNIYDMSGNVWECCEDRYGGYGSNAQTNPEGPSSGSRRVSRGGSWINDAGLCRVSCRNLDGPDFGCYDNLGFRLALSE